jgi:hypothetical protein
MARATGRIDSSMWALSVASNSRCQAVSRTCGVDASFRAIFVARSSSERDRGAKQPPEDAPEPVDPVHPRFLGNDAHAVAGTPARRITAPSDTG